MHCLVWHYSFLPGTHGSLLCAWPIVIELDDCICARHRTIQLAKFGSTRGSSQWEQRRWWRRRRPRLQPTCPVPAPKLAVGASVHRGGGSAIAARARSRPGCHSVLALHVSFACHSTWEQWRAPVCLRFTQLKKSITKAFCQKLQPIQMSSKRAVAHWSAMPPWPYLRSMALWAGVGSVGLVWRLTRQTDAQLEKDNERTGASTDAHGLPTHPHESWGKGAIMNGQ